MSPTGSIAPPYASIKTPYIGAPLILVTLPTILPDEETFKALLSPVCPGYVPLNETLRDDQLGIPAILTEPDSWRTPSELVPTERSDGVPFC
jgi:hypothetical protein